MAFRGDTDAGSGYWIATRPAPSWLPTGPQRPQPGQPAGSFGLTWWDGDPALAPRLVAVADRLSALAAHPTLPVVYGTAGEGDDGTVHCWRVTGPGRVGESMTLPSGGAEPCHLAVAADGHWLLVANYTSGTVAAIPLDETGWPSGDPVLTPLGGAGSNAEPARQKAPHPHQLTTLSDGQLLITDLGADLLRRMRIDPSGRLLPTGRWATPPGAGPRHLVLLPDPQQPSTAANPLRVAVAAELSAELLVGTLDEAPDELPEAGSQDSAGATDPAGVPARPARPAWVRLPGSVRTGAARSRSERNYPGDIAGAAGTPGPVYFANRGHDTISVFAAAPAPRLLAEVSSGVRWPQHLCPQPGVLLVAGWDSGQLGMLMLDDDGLPGPQPPALVECPGAAWLLPWHADRGGRPSPTEQRDR